MTDRICIQSNGEQTPHLSAQVGAHSSSSFLTSSLLPPLPALPQDVTSCCHLGDMGCHGGVPPTAYTYWTSTGVVTGGNYGDTSMCYSYEKQPCAHHTDNSSYPSCDDVEPDITPSCANEVGAHSQRQRRVGMHLLLRHLVPSVRRQWRGLVGRQDQGRRQDSGESSEPSLTPPPSRLTPFPVSV